MKRLRLLFRDKIAAVSFCIVAAVIAAGILAPWIAPHDPDKVDMELRFASASLEHWLGNDHLGRDILSRLIYGIRPSVLGVLAALGISVCIGAAFGFAAGYFRGKTDAFLMRVCDVMLSFPGYVMTLAVIGILGTGLENILFAFILTKWAWFARIIRTSVMQYAEADYVRFSRTIGCGHLHVMTKHIVPVASADLAVAASSSFGSMILQISGFSFLGLGIQSPNAEWGMMLNEAREVMFTRPEMMLAPGLAIMIVVCAVNYLSDALQVALDPKLTGVKAKRQREAGVSAAKLQGREVA